MYYWPPKLIVIFPSFIQIGYDLQIFDQYLSPINHTFLQVFCATKHIISFVTSKLLYTIGLQSVQSFFPLSSELAIICQYFNQYLRPINYAFLYIFCATKPNNSFVASKFLCTIGLQSLQSFFPLSIKLAIICQYFDQHLSPINHSFIQVFCAIKPNIDFVALNFLCTIGLQSVQSFLPLASKLAIICQYFIQYSSPINYAFLKVFYATKPNISFLTSKLLCTVGLQIVLSFSPLSSKLAIIFQYFDQYLSPNNHAFLQVFCATKPNISFVTSKLLFTIGLRSVQSFSLFYPKWL